MKFHFKRKRHLKKKVFAGFTLLELLVVIAIIGVLAVIIMVSVATARTKAKDAKTRQVLSSIRTSAASEKTTYGTFRNICTPGTQSGAVTSGDSLDALVTQQGLSASDVTCAADDDTFVVAFPLKAESGYWCVDYTGIATKLSTKTAGNAPYSCQGIIQASGGQGGVPLQIKLSLLGPVPWVTSTVDTSDPGFLFQSNESIDYYGSWKYLCVSYATNACPYVTTVDTPMCVSMRKAYHRTYTGVYQGLTATAQRDIYTQNPCQ